MWVAEVDRGVEGELDLVPVGHFAAAVPGDGAAQMGRQLAHRLDHRGRYRGCGVITGQVQQQCETGAALYQGANGAARTHD
jgi:hypothetical protein